MSTHKLTIESDGFKLDGKPFRFIAGAIHYFRVPREYWEDRLKKLKACGFNTVETYVAWNVHQPTEDGDFCFDGMYDLEEFLRIAQKLGLYAIVRPGPYICSEWEFGGFPWWLLKKPGIKLRCFNKPYLDAVNKYFDVLIPRLAKLQSTNGGPILMMQIENEYGSYGNDKAYLQALADGMRSRGIDVPFFTSDGADDSYLSSGTLPGVLKTVNFGSFFPERNDKVREHQPEGPLMCMEFWNGWFDHWFEEHHTRDPKEAADTLKEMLESNWNVCAYMFHGGTNFGLMNGANCLEEYQPTVTSYDDDAPLNECGDPTEKYWAFREVVSKFVDLPEIDFPKVAPKANYGTFKFTQSAKLFDNLDVLSNPIHSATPLTMEELDQAYGFVLYKTHVIGPREEQPLFVQGLHDYAHMYINNNFVGTQFRNDTKSDVLVKIPNEGIDVSILVENMGRINYGYNLFDRKGITEGVRLGIAFINHWDCYPLPLNDLSKVKFNDGVEEFDGTPVFLKYELEIKDEPKDTFIKLPGFKKGIIFVNGKILGRHWEVGPQRSAYLPAPFLNKGKNEVIVLELSGFEKPEIVFDDNFDLG